MDHTIDDEARINKRDALISLARSELGSMSKYADALIDSFASISAPKDPPLLINMITANHGGHQGGQTRKPGNILLNWRRLFRESPDLILTGAGSIAEPWLIPLAALSIFNKLWTNATIKLTKEQASCLFAMWHRCGGDHIIGFDQALASCRELYSVYKWPELLESQFSEIIEELETLHCIKRKEDKRVWLREWVRKSYT